MRDSEKREEMENDKKQEPSPPPPPVASPGTTQEFIKTVKSVADRASFNFSFKLPEQTKDKIKNSKQKSE